ncbi:MAG: ThiF family adenylyltransferase [Gemmataceae bacterium]
MSGIWFVDDIGRMNSERGAVAELSRSSGWLSDVRWFLHEASLALDATITVHGRPYPVRLTYPELFPAIPPVVRPQDADEHWSQHQYGDGTLCLEWGPDTWHAEVTGAMMLESAHRLLAVEAPDGPQAGRAAPSRHWLTQGQSVRASRGRLLVTGSLLDHVLDLPAGELRAADVAVNFRKHTSVAVVRSIRPEAGQVWTDPEAPRPFRDDGDLGVYSIEACVLRVAHDLKAGTVRAGAALRKLLGPWEHLLAVGDSRSVLLVGPDDELRFFRRFNDEDDLVQEYAIVRAGAEASARHPVECEALRTMSVGIAGLGSLGAKVAVSLARVGVGRFHLVDDDLFLPENVVRHALDLRAVGEHKAASIADLITCLSQHAAADFSEVRLGGQESNAVLSGQLERLAACDVVIDTTADPQVFNLLASAVGKHGKPLVWGQVFAGGIGGFVARSRPGVDPPPLVVRRRLSEYSEAHPAPDGAPLPAYAAQGPSGEVQIATDADVGVIAAVLTEFTLDVLLGRQPARFPQSLYLIGLERAWVFSAPLHVIPIDVGEASQDPPEAEPSDAKELEAGVGFIGQLIKEAKGESRPAS